MPNHKSQSQWHGYECSGLTVCYGEKRLGKSEVRVRIASRGCRRLVFNTSCSTSCTFSRFKYWVSIRIYANSRRWYTYSQVILIMWTCFRAFGLRSRTIYTVWDFSSTFFLVPSNIRRSANYFTDVENWHTVYYAIHRPFHQSFMIAWFLQTAEGIASPLHRYSVVEEYPPDVVLNKMNYF